MIHKICIPKSIILVQIGDVRFKNFKLADNLRAGIEVVKAKSPANGAVTESSLFVGYSKNMPDPIPHSLRDDPDRGMTFAFIASGQTSNYTVKDSVMVNFDKDDLVVFGSCSHCNFPNNKNQDSKITTMNVSKAHQIAVAMIGIPCTMYPIFRNSKLTMLQKAAAKVC